MKISEICHKEEKHLNYIIDKFSRFTYKRQYRVDGPDRKLRTYKDGTKRITGSFYKIDLYFPFIRLAIECDELGHKDRNTNHEIEREKYIKSKLNCKFIRFNPDSEDFDIEKVIKQIENHIKSIKYISMNGCIF